MLPAADGQDLGEELAQRARPDLHRGLAGDAADAGLRRDARALEVLRLVPRGPSGSRLLRKIGGFCILLPNCVALSPLSSTLVIFAHGVNTDLKGGRFELFVY